MPKAERIELNTILFVIQVFTELLTNSLVVLFRLMREHIELGYYIFISLSFLRVLYWIFISYKVAGRQMLTFWILPDSMLLFGTITCYSYIGYNLSLETEHPSLRLIALICFCVLIFFANGTIRCLIKFMKWCPWRWLVYKFTRMYGAVFYMGFGIAEIKRMCEDEKEDKIKDIYLLFLFTAMAYLTDIYLIMNKLDESEEMKVLQYHGKEESEEEGNHGSEDHEKNQKLLEKTHE